MDAGRAGSWTWLLFLVAGAASGMVWMERDARAGVVLAVILGGVISLLEGLGKPEKEGVKLPRGVPFLLGVGCLWVVVASVVLIAVVLRTVGVPQIEAYGTCYAAVVGSGVFTGFALRERIRRVFRGWG